MSSRLSSCWTLGTDKKGWHEATCTCGAVIAAPKFKDLVTATKVHDMYCSGHARTRVLPSKRHDPPS